MASTQLFPQVIDVSNLGARVSAPLYLPVGIEGEAAAGGTAVVGTIYAVGTPNDATVLFGAGSVLTGLITFLLGKGIAPVLAVASAKGASPTLIQRQAAWEQLASDPSIRLRMTDSVVQADLVALADSAEQADLIYNKQVAIVGMAAATTKAALLTAAGAIASKRGVLVGPGVYDENGTLRSGAYAAAAVCAEIAKNPDPSNDLDLWTLPALTGIEKDANGRPLFQVRIAAGVAVNDFEELLQGGVSPLQTSFSPPGVQITHLRPTYTVSGTHDSLYTVIITDQVFLDVKNYIMTSNILRLGNSAETRARLKSGVEAVLSERRSWISPIILPDGTEGYGVEVTSSLDERQLTVSYEGRIVRGVSTVQVAANLSIAV